MAIHIFLAKHELNNKNSDKALAPEYRAAKPVGYYTRLAAFSFTGKLMTFGRTQSRGKVFLRESNLLLSAPTFGMTNRFDFT